jgi:hypothetical protein
MGSSAARDEPYEHRRRRCSAMADETVSDHLPNCHLHRPGSTTPTRTNGGAEVLHGDLSRASWSAPRASIMVNAPLHRLSTRLRRSPDPASARSSNWAYCTCSTPQRMKPARAAVARPAAGEISTPPRTSATSTSACRALMISCAATCRTKRRQRGIPNTGHPLGDVRPGARSRAGRGAGGGRPDLAL